MGGQSISGQDRMNIAAVDQFGKGVAGVIVEGEGGAHNPDDFPVLPVMPQKIIDLVVIFGESRLPGAVLTKCKYVLLYGGFPEAVGIHINTVFAVFRPAGEDQVAGLQKAKFPNEDDAVFIYRHTVHPAFFCHDPLAVNFEILRENAHGVIRLRRYAVLGTGNEGCVGGVPEFLLGKIRWREGTQGKTHDNRSFTYYNASHESAYFSCILSYTAAFVNTDLERSKTKKFFEKRGKKVLTREGGSGSITGRREERRDAERVKEKREKNLKKVLDKTVRM